MQTEMFSQVQHQKELKAGALYLCHPRDWRKRSMVAIFTLTDKIAETV